MDKYSAEVINATHAFLERARSVGPYLPEGSVWPENIELSPDIERWYICMKEALRYKHSGVCEAWCGLPSPHAGECAATSTRDLSIKESEPCKHEIASSWTEGFHCVKCGWSPGEGPIKHSVDSK